MAKNTSLILTEAQHDAIKRIAKERYGGNLGRAIRAALETAYPSLQGLDKVGPAGNRKGQRVK
jgi:hypothetical protein